MWVVITIASITGLIILFMLLFSVPLDMTFYAEKYDKVQFKVKALWLFGIVQKELKKKKKQVGEKDANKPNRRNRRPGIRTVIEILKTRGLLRRVAIFLKELLKCLRMKELAGYFRIGLDDAADTGFLFAIIGPAISFLNYPCSIKVEPAFADAVFEGHLKGTVRIRPIKLIPPLLRFFFSRPAFKVFKVLFLARWRKQK